MADLTNSTCDTLYDHRNYTWIIGPIVYSVVFIIGLLGNILALHVIQINLKKMNSTTLYSLNLVISDILFTLSLPVRIIYYAQGLHWSLGEALCKVSAFLVYINTYSGIHFMTFLSVDRFIAVVMPLRFAKFRKVSIVRNICIGVWIVVLGMTLPLLGMEMTNREPQNFTTCMEYPKFDKVDNIAILLIGAVIFNYFIPVVTILVCHSFLASKLYFTAKNHHLTDEDGRNRKAIGVVCCVSVVFVICYSPYHINLFQYMIRKLLSNPDCADLTAFQVSMHITTCLMNINACLDPFIYFFACKGYKKKLKEMLMPIDISLPSAPTTSHEISLSDFIDTAQQREAHRMEIARASPKYGTRRITFGINST